MDIFSNAYNLALAHNINPYWFLIIYLLSGIPLYLGYFLIISGSTKSMTLKDAIFFKFKKLQWNQKVLSGIVISFIGLIAPYVYLLLWGRNLPPAYYVALFLIIIALISYALFEIKKSYTGKLTGTDAYEIAKKDVIVDELEKQELWQIYDGSFVELNKNAPCKQSFDKEHFMDALADSTAIKYITKTSDNKVIAMGMITNDFKNTPWISEEYFKNKFKEKYDKKLIYYFMGVAVKEGYRHQGLASRLIKRISSDLPIGALLGFDNSAGINFFIPYFTRIVGGGKKIKNTFLDSQNYYIISQK